MATDPAVRESAANHLGSLFSNLGQARQQNDPGLLGGGLAGQLEEFLQMPVEMAAIFMNMGMQMAELVLTSLEEAGYTLAKGLTPM